MHVLRNYRLWLVIVAGCTLLALTESTALHFDALRAGRASNLALLVVERWMADSVWVFVWAYVFASMKQLTSASAHVANIATRFTLVGLALAPIYTTSDAIAWSLMRDTHFATTFGQRLQNVAMTSFMWDGFLYLLVVVGCYAFLLRERARQQERDSSALLARLTQAELELLRAQLEPHFLFNALNAVSGLIRARRNEAATAALAQLSQLLRYVVEASRQERVPMEWELQFVRSYLELQQLRYGRRLAFTLHADDGARSCDVPPLVLQPLIENAVVHGVARATGPGRIALHVTRNHAQLHVDVQNSWEEPASPTRDTTGVGLTNTRQRLTRMYGDAFSLVAGPFGSKTWRVSVTLPTESLADAPDQRAYR